MSALILGIDIGSAVCGWALLDERARSFVDLGVVVTGNENAEPLITLDRARRCNAQAAVLATKIRGCTTIVVERASPSGDLNAGVPIALSWGVVLGLVATMDPRPRLLTIVPQRWQREVLPSAGRTVDYDGEIARVAGAYILERHPASDRFAVIPIVQRGHAIAAAMIALVAALRPNRCQRIT